MVHDFPSLVSSTLPSTKYSFPTNSYWPSSSSRVLTIFNRNSGVSSQLKFRVSSNQQHPLVAAINGLAVQFLKNSFEQQTAVVILSRRNHIADKDHGHEELREPLEKHRGQEQRNRVVEQHRKRETILPDSETQTKMCALEDELSKIVGLDELKLQLRTWAKGMLLNERRRSLGLKVGASKPPHMAFLGNPGTGKTMVARILGKLLHIVGILPTDKVTEVQRSDLVGKYIGHTAKQTRAKIEQATGGILFVDEAYRLMPETRRVEFGLEALEEIMSVMDSGKIAVIFAGYSEPMERVISSNEGFRRRVTKFFHFNDFSSEDIANVVHLKMTKQAEGSVVYGFNLHPSCSVNAIAALIEGETTEKQRKQLNGGLADIMLVNARENLDFRLDVDCSDADKLLTLTLEDFEAGIRLLPQGEVTTDYQT